MGLVAEIMNEVFLEERKANKERYVGRAKEIRIHPEWFYQLMADPEIIKSGPFIEGEYNLCGIPIECDENVEKWKIIV